MEQLMQDNVIKQSNQILKEIERGHHKQLIEENIRKIDETEAKKIEIVSSRINFVHDEERLKKLVRIILAPYKYQQKWSIFDGRDIGETGIAISNSTNDRFKKDRYLLLLQKQIQEKKHRDQEYCKIRESRERYGTTGH